MTKNKFIIGSTDRNGKKLTFSDKPFEHDTFAEAAAEAERLAGLYKNKSFVVVQIRGTVTAVQVQWS